jgi:hypothetical protein
MLIFFAVIVFVVSFLSDIVLNKLSTHYITSLRPYFYNQSILKCAFDAGLTVLVGLAITMLISFLLLGFTVPSNLITLFYFCSIAFVIGYLLDILIYKTKVFGDRLTLYYKTYGAGWLGAFAFVFAIVISYILLSYGLGRNEVG